MHKKAENSRPCIIPSETLSPSLWAAKFDIHLLEAQLIWRLHNWLSNFTLGEVDKVNTKLPIEAYDWISKISTRRPFVEISADENFEFLLAPLRGQFHKINRAESEKFLNFFAEWNAGSTSFASSNAITSAAPRSEVLPTRAACVRAGTLSDLNWSFVSQRVYATRWWQVLGALHNSLALVKQRAMFASSGALIALHR